MKGTHSRSIVAFSRRKGASWAVIVAPRFLVDVAENQQVPLGDVWMDTFVCLPPGAPKAWKDDFADESLVSNRFGGDEGFFVAQLLRSFPLGLLISGESAA